VAIGEDAWLELLWQGIEGVQYAVGDCIWMRCSIRRHDGDKVLESCVALFTISCRYGSMLKRVLISGSLSFEDDRFGEAEAFLRRDHRKGSTTIFIF
jgi:hypothetical protein